MYLFFFEIPDISCYASIQTRSTQREQQIENVARAAEKHPCVPENGMINLPCALRVLRVEDKARFA
jgi:hypothetical protein